MHGDNRHYTCENKYVFRLLLNVGTDEEVRTDIGLLFQ